MKNDSFFLITKCPIKNGIGFSTSLFTKESFDKMIWTSMLDVYVTMKVATEIAEKVNQFNNDMVEAMLNAVNNIQGDPKKEIEKTIKYIEQILPAQTSELKKLFLSITDEEEFIKRFMIFETEHKTIIDWREEPSYRMKPMSFGVKYFTKLSESIDTNKNLSAEQKDELKQLALFEFKNATQISIYEKFTAWAGLHNKKLQEEK